MLLFPVMYTTDDPTEKGMICYGYRLLGGCICPPMARTARGKYITVGLMQPLTAEALYRAIARRLEEKNLRSKYPLVRQELAILDIIDRTRVIQDFPDLFDASVTSGIE